MVISDFAVSPEPLVSVIGISKICMPPISDVTRTYRIVGFKRGSVILVRRFQALAPSTTAASIPYQKIPPPGGIFLPSLSHNFPNPSTPVSILPANQPNLTPLNLHQTKNPQQKHCEKTLQTSINVSQLTHKL